MGRITVICGLPNAGKTTFSSRFKNVYHFDDGINLEDIINLDDVVIEGLFETANARRKIANGTQNHCTLIWLNTPIDECIRRENRGRPKAILAYHHRLFQPPTLDEGWDEIITISNIQRKDT